MFGIGLPELLIILLVVLVLFGAGKLPSVMADMGKGINAFKKGMSGKDEDMAVIEAPKAKTAAAKKPAAKKTAKPRKKA